MNIWLVTSDNGDSVRLSILFFFIIIVLVLSSLMHKNQISKALKTKKNWLLFQNSKSKIVKKWFLIEKCST